MGALITRPGGEQYYFHQHDWVDMYGVRHYSGYYSPDGYRYANPADFGYTPPRGAPYPDGMNRGGGSLLPAIIAVVLLVLCCCAIRETMNQKSQNRTEPTDNYEQLRSQQNSNQDLVTREGQAIPRADAVAFIQALEAEYVDGAEGAVGRMFDSRSILPEVAQRLDCEEGAVRDARDLQGAVFELANRWGMRDVLNHS